MLTKNQLKRVISRYPDLFGIQTYDAQTLEEKAQRLSYEMWEYPDNYKTLLRKAYYLNSLMGEPIFKDNYHENLLNS